MFGLQFDRHFENTIRAVAKELIGVGNFIQRLSWRLCLLTLSLRAGSIA
jgi:hypothetical protein